MQELERRLVKLEQDYQATYERLKIAEKIEQRPGQDGGQPVGEEINPCQFFLFHRGR